MRLRHLATAVAALSLPTLVLLAPPASADGGTTIASGLNNPRLLSFSPTGDLYIAEAGTGGGSEGPRIEGGEGPAYFGLTGSVTRVRNGVQNRVLTNLPSVAAADGSNAAGPADIQVTGVKKYALSLGLGAAPSERAKLPDSGQILGTLQTGKFGGVMSTFGDLAGYEQVANPDGVVPDSNPVGITPYRGGYLVADAGGNDLNAVRRHRDISTVAVFPSTMVATPDGQGMMPMQAVPTSVVIGPDNAIYVSQLTGFPFPAGGSTIWRIKDGSAPTAYATGLTNVTDLAFKGKQLYAVQIAANGLLKGPIGSLVKVNAGSTSPTTVVGGLFAPYGVAIHHGTAYVTTCAVCAGGGTVQAFRL
ncbi:MAG: ScyD/ScyE family protein [Knoellia sp.]